MCCGIGLLDDTVFVLSSDHGDMQMQHQQFYKMVAYEASSHVPLVIAPGKNVGSMPCVASCLTLYSTLVVSRSSISFLVVSVIVWDQFRDCSFVIVCLG
jgi:phosphoglycerol transferase MdoB-like AlkP superfamily enzyme